MKMAIACLFLVPMMIFGDIQYTYEDAIDQFCVEEHSDPILKKEMKKMWNELDMPIVGESRYSLQREVATWLADPTNQKKLVQKLRIQIEGKEGYASSEANDIMDVIERSLNQWSIAYKIDEANESFQILHEIAKEHIERAFQLLLQSGVEVVAGGVYFMYDAVPLGAYELSLFSTNLLQGCKEYKNGISCQKKVESFKDKNKSP